MRITQADQEHYMRQALQQAEMALLAGDLPIGAVIVLEGEVVSRGRNRYNTRHVLRHAETEAILQAPRRFDRHSEHAAIFTTAEPCYMCYGAILLAGITHVYFAAPDYHFGAGQIHGKGHYERGRIHTWKGGILEREAFALMLRYSERLCRQHFGKRFEELLGTIEGPIS